MKSILFKILSTMAKVIQYFLYLLAAVLVLGGLCFLIFRQTVETILQEMQLPYWLLIVLVIFIAMILAIYGLIMRSCQVILKNIAEEEYFAVENITASLQIVRFLLLTLSLRIISNLFLHYLV